MQLPLERIWWVDAGKLIAGRYPGTDEGQVNEQALKSLLDFGVRVFINLQEPGETGRGKPFPDYRPILENLAKASGVEVETHRFPIRDGGTTTPDRMRAILDCIAQARAANKMVYVHCWGGHGRSATVAGCWLVEQGMSPLQALAAITANRSGDPYLASKRCPEMSSQVQVIRDWPRYAPKPTPTPTATGGDRDRVCGSLIGLACGDAVGTTLEFCSPSRVTPITDMVGGGPFGLKPGEWTDDTSLALCLADSLVSCGRFDPVDQLTRYVRWWREGYLSSNGRCFDIGGQTSSALQEFQRTGGPRCGNTGSSASGNGSLMRLAPVPMALRAEPARAIELAAESSATTHGSMLCQDSCRYFAGLLIGAFRGESKATLLAPNYSPVKGLWDARPLTMKVAEVAAGSFLKRKPPEIRGTGYVVACLEAALWAFATTESFEAAILAASNLGDDADTTAAVCGQIAGAFYGESGIPARWRDRLALRETIDGLAEGLWKMGSQPCPA